MQKSLDIGYYQDGYSAAEHINCIDIPVAATAGYYNYDNYYYYLFLCTAMLNWGKQSDNWLDSRNLLLKKLGLMMKPYVIENESELKSVIYQEINESKPILMIVKYKSLFYFSGYMEENAYTKGNHALIISGYNSDKSTIFIRDTIVVNRYECSFINSLVRGDALYQLYITNNSLDDIWERSNSTFFKENSNHYKKIYAIERVGTPVITNYTDLVYDFLNNFEENEIGLVHIVNNFDELSYRIKNGNSSMASIRMNMCNALIIIFEAFEKCFNALSIDEAIFKEYEALKKEYINFRSMILSKIHKLVLNGRPLTINEKENIIKEICSSDTKLFDLIKKLFIKNRSELKHKDEI